MNNYLVTFLSTHHALKAEKSLKKKNGRIDLIPTPREISSKCGFSLYLADPDTPPEEIMNGLQFQAVYLIKITGEGKKTYERID